MITTMTTKMVVVAAVTATKLCGGLAISSS